jgi:hypothetical protein
MTMDASLALASKGKGKGGNDDNDDSKCGMSKCKNGNDGRRP